MDVAVLIVDGAFDSGLATVLDVLETANSLRDRIERPPSPWRVTTVSVRREVRTGHRHRVEATLPHELPGPPDLLIVPALGVQEPDALVAEIRSPGNRPALDLISQSGVDGVPLAGACTGTFFLAEAGVLDGRAATTSWWLGPEFRQRYPQVYLDDKHTLVHAAGVSTAGAAFAHIDLALSVVQRQSPALAELVARYLVTGDRVSQAAFAVPTLLAQSDPVMAEFELWVRGNLESQIQISAAARELGLSERSLQRRTAATIGMSPVDFVREVRLEHATFLLRTTSLTVDAVARRVGYQNASTLHSLVRKRRSTTITRIRSGVGAGS
jgi:transcriptional regulator GlxA family with amidase domain